MSEEYVKNKIIYSKIFIVLGLLILIVTNVFPLLNGFWISILNFWGAFFLVFGLVSLLMIKRNTALVEANEVPNYGERNSIIRGQAAYLTFTISIIFLALMTTIFIYLDDLIPFYLSLGLMIGECIIYMVLIWYYSKKI
jgi:uncharacterized membrane protein